MSSSTNPNDSNPGENGQPPKPNMGQLLMGRRANVAKNKNNDNAANNNKNGSNQIDQHSQVASTPANIKRLQVKKWFNSPTDDLFSPCSKKLYNIKSHHQPVNLIDELEREERNENQTNDNNDDN